MTSQRAAARPTIRLDTEGIRATEWAFEPGAETGWHRHEYDYVIVPLGDGRLLLEEPGGGARTSELKLGVPYARKEGVEHNVVNASAGPFAFLEVELLDSHLTRRRRACLERFAGAWNAHDIEGLMACMAEDCEFLSAAGPEARGTAYRGRRAVRAGYLAVFEAFPDAAWLDHRHMVAGDRGFSEWRFVGTDREGVRVEVGGCDLFTFDGELIRVKDSLRKQRRPG
jgi:quercetin dioxygenase-like cupin family protein/ketosteroid isomerase-like protein